MSINEARLGETAECGQFYEAILETTPALIWMGDRQGRCVYLNRALRRFWGVQDVSTFAWTATLHPEDVGMLSTSFAEAMASQVPFQVEARYRRSDGAWRVLQTQAQPRFGSDGKFLGMVGVNLDVTERTEVERELRQSKEHLDFALEASGAVGVWVWDVQEDRLKADSKTWRGLVASGDQEQVEGTLADFLAAVHPEDRPRLCAAINEAVETGAPYRTEYRIVTPSGDRWVAALGKCEQDAAGRPTRFAGVTVDITERHQQEDAVLMLTRELSHRIKNVFTVVQMMTTLASKAEPEARPALTRLSRRLQALGAAHVLSLPNAGMRVMPVGLKALATQIIAPLLTQTSRFTLTGPDLSLEPEAANALALILNELATNSAKYGSLCADGQVELSIERSEGDLILRWSEDGGPAVSPPTSAGFGSRLINASAANLGGTAEWSWHRNGLVWTLRLPASRLALAG